MASEDLVAALEIAQEDASARLAAAIASAQIAAGATTEAAEDQATAQKYSADQQRIATITASQNDESATTQSASTRANADVLIASVQAAADEYVADAQAGASVQVANIRAAADEQVATISGTAEVNSATVTAVNSLTGVVQSASIRAAADESVASTQLSADVQVANVQASASTQVATVQVAGVEFGANAQLEGVEFAQNAETARLNEVLAFAQDKWNQIFPLIQPLIASVSNPQAGGKTASWESLLASLGAAPYVDASGVWTPSQIQQQLNALYARGDAKSQSDLYDASVDLAGRGFGGTSPLLDVLRFGFEAVNIQTSTEGAAQLSLSSSQANSEQLLKQEDTRVRLYDASERTFAELNRAQVELITGVFGAIAQIIGAVSRG